MMCPRRRAGSAPRAARPARVRRARRRKHRRLDEWLTRIEHSIKPSMAQNWRNYANYYVIPYIGERDVREIDGGVCDALYAKLLAEGRVKAKPKTAPAKPPVHVRRLSKGGKVQPCRPYRYDTYRCYARRRRSPARSACRVEQASSANCEERRPQADQSGAGAGDGR